METIGVIVLACVSAAVAVPESLIVGGLNAKHGQFPYQVSLRTSFDNEHYCGGSIISNRNILTAAHCTDGLLGNPLYVHAVVGTIYLNKGGTIVELEKFMQHPDWSESITRNDIALIRTVSEIVFSVFVQPIAIRENYIQNEDNRTVIVSGWGYVKYDSITQQRTSKNHLQFTEQHLISTSDCLEGFRNTDASKIISESILCTINRKHVGVCHGDSGGPLVDISDPEKIELIGIVSFGIPCAQGYPDAYTRVHYYHDWITKKSTELEINILLIPIIVFIIMMIIVYFIYRLLRIMKIKHCRSNNQ